MLQYGRPWSYQEGQPRVKIACPEIPFDPGTEGVVDTDN